MAILSEVRSEQTSIAAKDLSVPAQPPLAATQVSAAADTTADLPPTSNLNSAVPSNALNWPVLAKQLALRGVARQLAMQSELLACEDDGSSVSVRIRVPVETLWSAASKDKLSAALSEHLGKPVHLDAEIGATTQTAHAADVADEAARQRHAEQTLHEDPFVQTLMREFGATIVPGSVRPL
jgi:DNA polymerase-3 subunit gamma/tau